MLKKIPHTYSIISGIILIAAALTWIIPAGEFTRHKETVDGTERTLIKSDSFHYIDANPQSWEIFSSLLKGFEKQAGIIAFLIIIGGAFQILNATKAIDTGIHSFLKYGKELERRRFLKKIGVDNIVIILIMTLFSLFGSIFGMSEETLPFVIIVIPLAVSMGYDSITGLCMVYVAAHIGFAGAILNPFTIGIAQGLSDLPLFSGMGYRILCWLIFTITGIVFVLFYASKVKKRPKSSPTHSLDSYWRNKIVKNFESAEAQKPGKRAACLCFALIALCLGIFSFFHSTTVLTVGESRLCIPVVPVATLLFLLTGFVQIRKSASRFILSIIGFSIIFLIIGVMGHGWYLPEISALFLAMGIAGGFSGGLSVNLIIKNFNDGAKDMISTAIVVGLAGGIIHILNEGHIIDTILYALSSAMKETGKTASIGIMYAIQTVINIIIPSGSAKAALTMPIMAPFSDVIGISRQATVLAFQFGDGITNMITPTSAVLMGALGMARIPYDIWVRWFYKFIILLIIIGFILLIPTVVIPLTGF